MSEFEDPHKKIDRAISQKEQNMGAGFKSKGVQRVYDNINFGKDVLENPIVTKKYDKEIFGAETISLQSFLAMRIWPRSIYTTDKLMRLIASSRLEFLKRYLAKKHKMSFNMLWLLIIIFGVAVAVLVILFLVPGF